MQAVKQEALETISKLPDDTDSAIAVAVTSAAAY